jgi:hypothetical protein
MIQHPRNVTELSKANACFYMFVDEETMAYVKNSSSLYKDNEVGLWRLVVVRNLPYEDPRRTGKVPFLLTVTFVMYFPLEHAVTESTHHVQFKIILNIEIEY